MSKIKRILFSSGLLALSAMSVVALTFMGSRATGPLGGVLADIGSTVTRAESRVAFHFRGPGRAAELRWFQDLRRDKTRLLQPDQVLIGAYDSRLPASFEGLTSLEASLETPMPLVHIFAAWGDEPEHLFPRKIVETIWDIGSVPVVTWEPWLSTFDDTRHTHLPAADQRDRGGMAAVALGHYDFYLLRWLQEAADFGQPLFVRFGHEMNDAYRYPWGPHNNRPEEYIAAFRHVVEVARETGATNIIWVWSPHVAYEGFNDYYPGNDVVDWVAATVLNYGNVAHWSEWWTFDDIFTRKYDLLAEHDKPVMIAEIGALMAGGERAPWFEQALTRVPQRLPEVKAIVFFHNHRDATITYQALDWAFDRDPAVISAIKRAMDTWNVPSEPSQNGTSLTDL